MHNIFIQKFFLHEIYLHLSICIRNDNVLMIGEKHSTRATSKSIVDYARLFYVYIKRLFHEYFFFLPGTYIKPSRLLYATKWHTSSNIHQYTHTHAKYSSRYMLNHSIHILGVYAKLPKCVNAYLMEIIHKKNINTSTYIRSR